VLQEPEHAPGVGVNFTQLNPAGEAGLAIDKKSHSCLEWLLFKVLTKLITVCYVFCYVLLPTKLSLNSTRQRGAGCSQFVTVVMADGCIQIASDFCRYQTFLYDKIYTIPFRDMKRSGIVNFEVIFIGTSHIERLLLLFHFIKSRSTNQQLQAPEKVVTGSETKGDADLNC
jgi:hypothetical protein